MNVAEAVAALLSDSADASTRAASIGVVLDYLDASAPNGDDVLERLVPTEDGVWGVERVTRCMAALVRIAALAQDLSLRLMVKLYPKALALKAHNICDSIDLWITSNPDAHIDEFLERERRVQPNPRAVLTLDEWLEYRRDAPRQA